MTFRPCLVLWCVSVFAFFAPIALADGGGGAGAGSALYDAGVVNLPLGQAERDQLLAQARGCYDRRDAGCYVSILSGIASATHAAYHSAFSLLRRDPAPDRKVLNARCGGGSGSYFEHLKCYSATLDLIASDARKLLDARARRVAPGELMTTLESRGHFFGTEIRSRCGAEVAEECFDRELASLSSRFAGAREKMQKAFSSFMHWSYLVRRCDERVGAGVCWRARDWSSELLEPVDSIEAAAEVPAAAPPPDMPPGPRDPSGGAPGSPGGNAPGGGSGPGSGSGGGNPTGPPAPGVAGSTASSGGWTFNPFRQGSDCDPGGSGSVLDQFTPPILRFRPGMFLPPGALNPSDPPAAPRIPGGTPRDPTGMASALEAADRARGLGRGGGAESAVYDAAVSSPNAPQEGAAEYVLETDAQGRVVSVRLGSSSDARAWGALVPEIREGAARKSFRVPPGSPGLRVTVRVEARYQLPSGSTPGYAVRPEVGPGSVGARFDLSDIGGGGGSRVVSARVVGEASLDAN